MKKRRTKEQIIQRMNEIGITHRVCMGMCPTARADPKGKIDVEARKIPFVVISANNAGERYDWWDDEVYIEELEIKGANYDGLETFFTDHCPSVDNAIGRVENIREESDALLVDVVFGSDERSDTIFKKYVDGILNDVSIGYRVNDIVLTQKKDEPDHVLVTDFEIVELSAVWRGFDSGAKIARQKANANLGSQDVAKIGTIDILERELKLKAKEL